MGRGDPRDDENEKLVAAADFDGPTRHRRFTDLFCLLLLFAMWIGMTILGSFAMANGDYRLVVYPLDYDGNICGTDFTSSNDNNNDTQKKTDMTDYPYLYYINSYGGGVCVKDCPVVSEYGNDNGSNSVNLTDIYTLVTYNGIWQVAETNETTGNWIGATLPTDFIQVGDYSASPDALSCTKELCYPNNDPTQSWTSPGIQKGFGFAYYAADTYELLWRCYYTDAAINAIETIVNANATDNAAEAGLDNAYDQAYQFWNKLYADLAVSWKYILGFGFGLSVGISFFYVFMMRIPLLLTAVIWASIFGSIAMLALAGFYAGRQANEWYNEEPRTVDDRTITVTSGLSFALYIAAAIVLLLGCCMRAAIQKSITAVKQAGAAVNHMLLVLAVPVLQAAGFVAFMAIFILYGTYLASLGNITTQSIPLEYDLDGSGTQTISVRVYEFNDFVKYCGWYMLFCLFWTANFIVAVGDMILALAVAHYYFARDKMRIGSWTVVTSTLQVVLYHAGTCAYGSLILSIVQMIRAIIARFQRIAKQTNNTIARIILCCCQCFFCCMECCIKFMSKNAYIQTAIFSTSFCTSCRKAFFLIARNAARIAALSYVSAAVLIVGKLFISACTTSIAYYAITENLSSQLHSVAGPVTVIFLISYWVSDFFMDIFDMAISTMLICLIADEEMFEGDGLYAEKGLQDYVDKHGSGQREFYG